MNSHVYLRPCPQASARQQREALVEYYHAHLRGEWGGPVAGGAFDYVGTVATGFDDAAEARDAPSSSVGAAARKDRGADIMLEQQLEAILEFASQHMEPSLTIYRWHDGYEIAIGACGKNTCFCYKADSLADVVAIAAQNLSQTLLDETRQKVLRAERDAAYWRKKLQEIEGGQG